MTKYRIEILICFLLIVITVAVFGQLYTHEFVNYDDDGYVTKNEHVRSGWTRQGVIWAFTTRFHRHWHPITWLSHMTDCQLFGMNAGWHHMSSLFFHVANTILLFLLLNRTTQARWRSAFVAALFALHPLHVEPVAWIADRKDVLCTFFGILTLWAYTLYSEHPGILRYLMVLFFFVLGLMAKSMVVTLPFVLLLMDFWPLRRFRLAQPAGDSETQNHESPTSRYQPATALRLIGEKSLLFIILGVTIFVTVTAMYGIQTQSLVKLSTHWGHIANTLVHYVIYLGKTIWPHSLTVIYPSLGSWQVGQVLGAGMIIVLITVLMLFGAKHKPYLATGWLWFLITLLPVIGIVKGSPSGVADRYTYMPLIGLFIIIAWGVPDITSGWRYRRVALTLSAGIIIISFSLSSWLQLRHWENSIRLFAHIVRVTENNAEAHNNFGTALKRKGRLKEAIRQYTAALQANPGHAKAHNNLGNALKRQGRFEEAIYHYYEALAIRPHYDKAHYNLANALTLQGRLDEAIEHYTKAIQIKSDYTKAYSGLGNALSRQGRLDEAVKHYSAALRYNPNYAGAQVGLQRAMRRLNKASKTGDTDKKP